MVLVALPLAVGTSEGTSDSLKVVQASEILAKIELGELIEYDDHVVEGYLNLSERALGTVHFNNTVFLESVIFKNTNFTGSAWFRGAKFGGDANFRYAKFGGDANFQETIFSSGDGDFYYVYFNGYVNFMEAIFSGGDANFRNAVFSGGDADFRNAVFSGGDADFTKAKFLGEGTSFDHAVFSGGDAHFRYAVFFGDYVEFSYAEFSGGDARFQHANFSAYTTSFFGTEFSKNAMFGDAIFGSTNQNESFGIELIYAQFNRDAYFENAIFYGNSKLDLTRSSYKRMFLPWSSIDQNQISRSNEDAYLTLMKNYMNLGWFEDANNCYYEYRNIRRNNEGMGLEWVTDQLEWLLYGYGVRPFRTLGWIINLIYYFGVFFKIGGGVKKYIRVDLEEVLEDGSAVEGKAQNIELKTTLKREETNFIDPFLFSLTTFTSGLTSFLYPTIEYKAEKHTRLVIIERLLGSIFLALLITAFSKTYLIR